MKGHSRASLNRVSGISLRVACGERPFARFLVLSDKHLPMATESQIRKNLSDGRTQAHDLKRRIERHRPHFNSPSGALPKSPHIAAPKRQVIIDDARIPPIDLSPAVSAARGPVRSGFDLRARFPVPKLAPAQSFITRNFACRAVAAVRILLAVCSYLRQNMDTIKRASEL